MEIDGNILEFLENRSILVTGAVGYIATVFVEKILRVQPNVKKLYLLLRAADTESAILRFNNEAVAKELFKVLKEKYGEKLSSFLSHKVTVVPGDITYQNLGVKDLGLLGEMWKQVDVVVNIAATTSYDERYDVSLALNTLGAKHVLDFSKKCDKLKVLLHVSTAYISGEREGLILESPYQMGESLNGVSGLDIDFEKKLVDDTINELQSANRSQDFVKSAMKDLGLQRARKYGWPNTYVFTKAMGEMLLGQLKENVPLVIIRPTTVTSTFKEPFPGWIEGIRAFDSLIVTYGKGRLPCFVGDVMSVIDVIPADMVVNAMIVAMVAHANHPNESIYHVGSSLSNPIQVSSIQDYMIRYFIKNPWINKEGKKVIVGEIKVLSTIDSFQRYMAIRYLLPLKGLEVVNAICCQYFEGMYLEMRKRINIVTKFVNLYKPFLFFKGYYDDMNTEKLRMATKENGVDQTDMFNFDPKSINWEDYFMNAHFPGLVKRVFK